MSLKNTWKEFKEFAAKGNVLDMAVGVIIGGAFGQIVTSLVNDILMPIISVFTGGINFTDLFIAMDGGSYQTAAEAAELGVATVNYGTFIAQVVDFLIIAFVIFMMMKLITRYKKVKVEPAQEPITKICPYCKSEIPIDAIKCAHCTSDVE